MCKLGDWGKQPYNNTYKIYHPQRPMEYQEQSTQHSVITYMEKDTKINRYMYICK